MNVKRPVLRYHGGKWVLAPWIISHFPKHKVYVEPYCGGASVLMRKPRSYAEVINDRSDWLVNVFKVLRDSPEALEERLRLTPFSRTEYSQVTPEAIAKDLAEDPIEAARKIIFRSFAAFGSGGSSPNYHTGFRANANQNHTAPAHDWAKYPDHIQLFKERLKWVTIENKDALEVMKQQDSPETLHYVDPPYPQSTRSSNSDVYDHEMNDFEHEEMGEVLKSLKGKVCISGYACDLYDKELFPDWNRVQKKTRADGNGKRVEVLWMNYSHNIQLSIQ